jgi:hypothetical protein
MGSNVARHSGGDTLAAPFAESPKPKLLQKPGDALHILMASTHMYSRMRAR